MTRTISALLAAGDNGVAPDLLKAINSVLSITEKGAKAEEALSLFTHQLAVSGLNIESGVGRDFYLNRLLGDNPEFIRHVKAVREVRGYARHASKTKHGEGKFSFIDLFAGIGGFHLALSKAGGHCVFASEWDNNARITYAVNHGIFPFGDIRGFTRIGSADQRPSVIRKTIPYADVVAAGFPCQPFSLAGVSSRNHHGHDHGLKCATQGTLFHDIVLIARAIRPKILFLENVKNLATHDRGNTIQVILGEIQSAGYQVFPRNIGTRGWAVVDSQAVSGQRRKRVYLVCVRNDVVEQKGDFEFPDFSFVNPASTLREVIAQDNSMSDAEKFARFSISSRLWESHLDRDRRHAAKSNGFTTNFMYDLDQPSPTLVARYFKDGKDCLIPHRSKNHPPRMLTPRECAILQTYPSRFWIPEAKSVAYKQFGNSITVKVAEKIARRIVGYLS